MANPTYQYGASFAVDTAELEDVLCQVDAHLQPACLRHLQPAVLRFPLNGMDGFLSPIAKMVDSAIEREVSNESSHTGSSKPAMFVSG